MRPKKNPEDKAGSRIRITSNSFARWKRIKEEMGFRYDEELAAYLLSIVDTTPLPGSILHSLSQERAQEDGLKSKMADIEVRNQRSLLQACQGTVEKQTELPESSSDEQDSIRDIQIVAIKGNVSADLGTKTNGDVLPSEKTGDDLTESESTDKRHGSDDELEMECENETAVQKHSDLETLNDESASDIGTAEIVNADALQEERESRPSSIPSPANAPSTADSQNLDKTNLEEDDSANVIVKDTAESDSKSVDESLAEVAPDEDTVTSSASASQVAEADDSCASRDSVPDEKMEVEPSVPEKDDPVVNLDAELSDSSGTSKTQTVETEPRDQNQSPTDAQTSEAVLDEQTGLLDGHSPGCDTPEVYDVGKDIEMTDLSSAADAQAPEEEGTGLCLQIESVCSLAPGSMCLDLNQEGKADQSFSEEEPTLVELESTPVPVDPSEVKASNEAEAAVAELERASRSPEEVHVPDCVVLGDDDEKDVDDCVILNDTSQTQSESSSVLRNALKKPAPKSQLSVDELEKISKEVAAVTSSLTVKLPSSERKKKDSDDEGNTSNVKLRILERSDFLSTCQEAVGVSCKVAFDSRGVSGSVSMYFCNFCNYSSANRNMFVSHVVKHLFLCNKCTFQSMTRLGLLKHVMSHDDANFDDYNIVVLSQVDHYVNEAAELPKKKTIFAPPSENEAILEYGKGKRYFCTLCDFRSNTLNAVERHILVHIGCWVCPACFCKFEQFTQAVTHLMNAHARREKKLMNRVVKGSAEDAANAPKLVKHRLMSVSVVTDPIDVSEYYYDVTAAYPYLLVLPDFHIPLIAGNNMDKHSAEELRKSHQLIVSASRFTSGASKEDSSPWSCKICDFIAQFAPHVAYHSIMCHPGENPVIVESGTSAEYTISISEKLKQKYLHLVDLMYEKNKAAMAAEKRQKKKEQKNKKDSAAHSHNKGTTVSRPANTPAPQSATSALTNLLMSRASSTASPLPISLAQLMPAIGSSTASPVTTSAATPKQIFLPSNMPIKPNTLLKTADGLFMLQPSSTIASPVVVPPGAASNFLTLSTQNLTGTSAVTTTSTSKTLPSILSHGKTSSTPIVSARRTSVPTPPTVAICTAPASLQSIAPITTTSSLQTGVTTSTASGNKSFYRLSPGTNVSFNSGKNKFTLINKSGQLYLQPMDGNPNSPLLPVKVNADGNFQVMVSKSGSTSTTSSTPSYPLTARLNAPSVPTTRTITSLLTTSSLTSSTMTTASAASIATALKSSQNNLPVDPIDIKREQIDSTSTTTSSRTVATAAPVSASGVIPTYTRVLGSATSGSGTTRLVISGRNMQTISGTSTTPATSLLSSGNRGMPTASSTPTTVNTADGRQYVIMRSTNISSTTQVLRNQVASQGVTTIVCRRAENGQLIPSTTMTTTATSTVATSKPDEPKHIYVTIEKYCKVVYQGSLSKFSCNFCDYKTGDRQDMQVHICKHNGGKKWYRCPFCEYESSARKLVLFHHHETHRGKKYGNIPTVSFEGDVENNNCPFCDFTANSMEQIVEHISSEHPDPETDINAALFQEGEGDEASIGPPSGCPWYQCQHCEFSNADLYCLKCHILQEHEGRELIGINLLTSHSESQDLVFMCSNKCCLFTTMEYDELVSHSEHCAIPVVEGEEKVDDPVEEDKDDEVTDKETVEEPQPEGPQPEEEQPVPVSAPKKASPARRKKRSRNWGPKSKRRKVKRASSTEEDPPPPPPPAPPKDSETSDMDFVITVNMSGEESSNSALDRGRDKNRTPPVSIERATASEDEESDKDSRTEVETRSKTDDVETTEKLDQEENPEEQKEDAAGESDADLDATLSAAEDDHESEADSVQMNVESTINQLKSLGASIEGSSVSDMYSSNDFTDQFKPKENDSVKEPNQKEAADKENEISDEESASDLQSEKDEGADETSKVGSKKDDLSGEESDEESRRISEIERDLQNLSESTPPNKESEEGENKSDADSTRSSPMPELYIEPDLEGAKVGSDNDVDLEAWFNTIDKENDLLKSRQAEKDAALELVGKSDGAVAEADDSQSEGERVKESDVAGVEDMEDDIEEENEDSQSTALSKDNDKLVSDKDIQLFEDPFVNDMPKLSPSEPDDKLLTNDINLFEDPFDPEQADVPSVSDNEEERTEKSSEVDQDIRLFEDPFEDERQQDSELKESSLDNSGTTITDEQEDIRSVSESNHSEELAKPDEANTDPLDDVINDVVKSDKVLSPLKATRKRRSVTKKAPAKKSLVVPSGYKCMHCAETSDHVLPLKIHLMREHPDANLTCIDLKAEYNRQRKYVQFCMLRQCDYYSLVTKDLVRHYEECPDHIVQDALVRSLSTKAKTERVPRKRQVQPVPAPDPTPLSPSGSFDPPEPSEVGSDMTFEDDAESSTSAFSELVGPVNVRKRKKVNYNEGHLAGISDADLFGEPVGKKRRKPGKRAGKVKELSPGPATFDTLTPAAAPLPNVEPAQASPPSQVSLLPAQSCSKKEKSSSKITAPLPTLEPGPQASPQLQASPLLVQSPSKKDKSSSKKSAATLPTLEPVPQASLPQATPIPTQSPSKKDKSSSKKSAPPLPTLESVPQATPPPQASSVPAPSSNKKEKSSSRKSAGPEVVPPELSQASPQLPAQSSGKKEKTSSKKSAPVGPEIIPTEFKWHLKCGHCLYHDKTVPNMKKHLVEKHPSLQKPFATDVYARHQRKKSQIFICLKLDCDFKTYRTDMYGDHCSSQCGRFPLEKPPSPNPSYSEMNSSIGDTPDYSYMDTSGKPGSPSKPRHPRDIQNEILSMPDVHKCRYCDHFMVDMITDSVIPQIQQHHKSHHPDEACLLINERNRLLQKPSRTFFCTEEGCTFFAATAAFLFAHQTGHEDPSMKDFINTESDVLATYDDVMDL